mmetsp:Transcript_11902/g.49861  ORF Transcript_11902/g.49861 Transcript_11902/m.49861 type:complete len:172 (-) Transcript_11902:1113-1628(-)
MRASASSRMADRAILDSTHSDGKIDPEELGNVFQLLRHKTKKSDIEDMIWEVDDDCDKCVNWPEFQAMYHRCRNDKTGYEPRRLFNVVEFLMNDKDDNGSVSVEEAMQILYLRHGRSLLDTQLEEIFGTSDTNSMKDLSLTEFLESLNSSHVKQLRSKAAAKLFKPLPGKP